MNCPICFHSLKNIGGASETYYICNTTSSNYEYILRLDNNLKILSYCLDVLLDNNKYCLEMNGETTILHFNPDTEANINIIKIHHPIFIDYKNSIESAKLVVKKILKLKSMT